MTIKPNFDGQINLYKSTPMNTHYIEYFFMKKEIISRDYNVTPLTKYNACDDLVIQRLNNTLSIKDVIQEFIDLKIAQGYKIIIEE